MRNEYLQFKKLSINILEANDPDVKMKCVCNAQLREN